jgi:hypothetical protein
LLFCVVLFGLQVDRIRHDHEQRLSALRDSEEQKREYACTLMHARACTRTCTHARARLQVR